jgi:hypothetical protein
MVVPTRSIQIPTPLAETLEQQASIMGVDVGTLVAAMSERLENEAKSMGLDVPSYLLFLQRAKERGHKSDFMSGMKFVFSKYEDTLRKLAE